MSNVPDRKRLRELGIDFGSLAQDLEESEYPTTSSALVDDHGDTVLQFQTGEQTLRELFEPVVDEQFESAAEVRETIFTFVGDQAIGRKGYSDRTPPAPGEIREEADESF